MGLTARVQRDSISYTAQITEISEKTIIESKQRFEELKASGVISGDYEDDYWVMFDGVQRKRKIGFSLDEMTTRNIENTLPQSSAKAIPAAMRIVATSLFGYATNYIQTTINALKTYMRGWAIPENAEPSEYGLLSAFLQLLPELPDNLADQLDDLDAMAATKYTSSMSQVRICV